MRTKRIVTNLHFWKLWGPEHGLQAKLPAIAQTFLDASCGLCQTSADVAEIPEKMTSYEPDINHRIWQVVAAIPEGRVATYGGIAQKAGLARAARRVGRALRGLPDDTLIPWHRVVNAQGRISLPAGSATHDRQRERLEQEGVTFSLRGTINLRQFGW